MTASEREEVKVIRDAYLDKYDGAPPFEGSHGFTTNIVFLEMELARVRLLLRKIDVCDCAATEVKRLAVEALKIRLHE